MLTNKANIYNNATRNCIRYCPTGSVKVSSSEASNNIIIRISITCGKMQVVGLDYNILQYDY